MDKTTHPKGDQPRFHNFEIKLSQGTITYRISNNTYQSTEIWRKDYTLFRKKTVKFGIIYCDHWKNTTLWQPLRYDCIPTLKVALPIKMLDQTPSSNSGINFLVADEVSHPTLIAASAIIGILFLFGCLIQCCCQLTNFGGTAIALQRTRKSNQRQEFKSIDPTLNHLLTAATNQPRAGHV